MSHELLAPDQDRTWREIIEGITEQLGTDEIPDVVIEAVELLLSGYPTREVASMLDVRPATIQKWIKQYPQIAVILADSRNSLIRWRMNVLDQQFLQAVRKSGDILNLDLTDENVNSKLVTAIGQHARYILGLFAGQKIDIKVTHGLDDTLLRARQDALQYLIDGITKQRDAEEPITTTFRVLDNKSDSGPLLDENGQPFYGQLGSLTTGEQGFQCHICGKYYKWLQKHIISAHEIDTESYELTFLLEPGSLAEIRPDRKS